MMPGGFLVPTTTGADHDRRDHRHPDRAQCDITLNQVRLPADAVGRRIDASADLHPGRRRFEPARRATCVSSPGAAVNRIRALGRCRPLARTDEGNRALTRY
jgi:hypothetical protein